MTTPFRHPTDDTLFDHVEGTLDPGRAPDVERHLSRCAACAAFVASAGFGAEAATRAMEPVPDVAIAELDAALDAAWRDHAGATTVQPVVVHEATGAAQETTRMHVQPSSHRGTARSQGRASARPDRPRRRFVRQAIPVFAVIVVGVLAGTSVYVDGRDGGREDGVAATADAPEDSVGASRDSANASRDAADAPQGERFRDENAADATDTDAAGAQDPEAGTSTVGPSDAAPNAGSGSEPSGEEANEADDEICIATNDPTQLYLPQGRLPREVIEGPLGTFVVCG